MRFRGLYQAKVCDLDDLVVWAVFVVCSVEEVLGLEVAVDDANLREERVREGEGEVEGGGEGL